MKPNKFTKIVATIGPASRSYHMVKAIIEEGADVIRLNFSHGTLEDHENSVDFVRKASRELDKPVAVFQDLQGPKIRVGKLKTDYVELKDGKELIITTDKCMGDETRVSIDYPNLHNEAEPGNRILLDDGLLELQVIGVEGKNIHTRIMHGGKLKPRKGVNLPHIKLDHISAFTEKDVEDLNFAFRNYMDYIALSFVRNANDVIALKDHMQKNYGRTIPIIAKIEKPEAVDDLQNIIDVSDAIMVARGDLGVETSSEEVPIIQKKIIRLCNLAGKPVITATQMLESMINNPRPTRAEAADVANAILDGTSAVMLSGETAAGAYPVEAVQMMKKIAERTEESLQFQRIVFDQRLNQEDIELNRMKGPAEAVAHAAIGLVRDIKARYIVCFTHSGGTARLIAKYRPNVPVVGFSPETATVRRLALAWGVIPMEIGQVSTVDELLDGAPEAMRFKGLVQADDYIVVTAGVPVGKPGKTNMIKVVQIEE